MQITTNFQNIEENNPIIIYPMLNYGNELNPFNTPKKRLPTEETPYIPETICTISRDTLIENLTFSETAQEINIQGVNTLSVSTQNKYTIEILAQTTLDQSDSFILKKIKSTVMGGLRLTFKGANSMMEMK